MTPSGELLALSADGSGSCGFESWLSFTEGEREREMGGIGGEGGRRREEVEEGEGGKK